MGERISKVSHRGKEIVILDLSGLDEDEIVAIFPKFEEFQLKHLCPRIVVDVTGTKTTDRVKEVSGAVNKRVAEAIGAAGDETSTALVGIEGIKKVIANSIQRGQYFAASREDALDHLAAIE